VEAVDEAARAVAAAAEEERIAEDDVDVGAVSEAASLPASAARRDRGDISGCCEIEKVCFPFFSFLDSSSSLFAIVPCFFPYPCHFLSVPLFRSLSLSSERRAGSPRDTTRFTHSQRERT
jgi:hypothetical protein